MRVLWLPCMQAMMLFGPLTTLYAAQTEPRLLSNPAELQPQQSVVRNADELTLSLNVRQSGNYRHEREVGKPPTEGGRHAVRRKKG